MWPLSKKWTHSRAAEMLDIRYPIIQGPFGGGLSSAKLVAAVSNYGGLGGYGAYQLEPDEISVIATDIRRLTNKPFALNLWVNDTDNSVLTANEYAQLSRPYRTYFEQLGLSLPPVPEPQASRFAKQAERLIREKVPVFSFVFGIPDKAILDECRKQGIVTIGAATTPSEAAELEAAGVDMLVASGFEAGGHRPSFIRPAHDSLMGTFSLVPQVAAAVQIPVIAAGGVTNAQTIAAAFMLGADAVQIGTAFLACIESGASHEHRAVLFSERAKHTTLTRSFTGRLARGIHGHIAAETEMHNALPFPQQTKFMSSLRKAAIEKGLLDWLSWWGGQSAPLIRHQRADELMQVLCSETEMLLGLA
jgi:nitronate monooxygenase